MPTSKDLSAAVDACCRDGRLAEAAALCRALLREDPRHPEALHRLGVLHHLGRDYVAAARLFAAAASSGHPAAHGDLAVSLMKAGRPEDALAQFRKAHALAPQDARVGYNLAMALLAAGDLREGFCLYEQRWHLKGPTPWVPRWDLFWDGRPLDGGVLLLHAEQGFGDTIQFSRYVPLAAARGARVVLAVPAVLRRLVAGLDGVDGILSEGERIPAYAAHAPLMSLPRIFRTGRDTVPNRVPYLGAGQEGSAPTSGARGPIRVGLAWAGRAEDPDDAHRSLPVERLAPLLALPGLEFHSLQKGAAEADLDRVEGGGRVIRHGESFGDFADTATVMAGLDLVIGVDTAVVHLAGALGKPVWILLSADPDWRWMRGCAHSPWYPTAHLFRQPALGAWEPVLADVGERLKAALAGHG
ncbi:tetratricopeptide repeat protein [Azospirillum sp. SYSU D00513]|uniref:tetratricopeptide repeat protein n=1 Tax=Azospirillum sp. SYSU D00513 TaxID=2812561 RepID=UPI001A972E09|nr:tetratricopeptide repeat protein [Azospirillum sp. SYSU D00513]